jgi:hypothetical protein
VREGGQRATECGWGTCRHVREGFLSGARCGLVVSVLISAQMTAGPERWERERKWGVGMGDGPDGGNDVRRLESVRMHGWRRADLNRAGLSHTKSSPKMRK